MGGSSTMTVKTDKAIKPGSTTDEALEQIEAANAATYAKKEAEKKDPPDPLAPPTLTDKTLAAARKAQYLKLNTGQGRKASFLSGPVGDLSAPTLNKKSLGY